MTITSVEKAEPMIAARRRRPTLSGLIVLFILPLLVGCGAGYLDDPPDDSQNKCPEGRVNDPRYSLRPAHAGNVIKIRLTNAGEFVDRCELTDALYDLNWDLPKGYFGTTAKSDAVSMPKLVVLYIHGWKHSAANDDPDYLHFTHLISQLANVNANRKQVLGIYIGWNAASKIPPLNWDPFNNLTFWSKETIADRIAQTGVITKIVGSISAILSNAPDSVDSSENQFIAIGHSFGARMLFSATNQALIYETEKAHPGFPGGKYNLIEGVANAVILLNPAFEAARYTPIDDVTRIDERFANTQLPLLLSVSSEGDLATKVAFPIGQWLGTYRSERELTALGNYIQYQTHSLRIVSSDTCSSTAQNSLSEHFVANGICLARDTVGVNRNIVQERNPFLVARTTFDIISNHNDVWNDRFYAWLFAYINELGNRRRPRMLDEVTQAADDSKPSATQSTTEFGRVDPKRETRP